jgi:hypothetical protein
MSGSKSGSVGKKEKIEDVKKIEGTKIEKVEDTKFVDQKMIDDLKIIIDEFLEDGEMFEDEEKFWEKMNDIKKKIVEEEEKPKKKQCLSLYNKYKRKREGEDTGEFNIYKKRSVPEYFHGWTITLTLMTRCTK